MQRPVAQIMMARVEPGKKLAHRWESLDMPWADHLSPTHLIKLQQDHRVKQLDWYRALLAPFADA
ncbi:MAG: hypothetical protein JKX81_11690 [Arenicella sp.]|nr:hypothetical protein [Arenicella sp.]